MHTPKAPPSARTIYRLNAPTLTFLILLTSLPLHLTLLHAQISEDQEELMYLRDKAEEAMSVGAPQTAASNTGKAALLASLMAKQETRPAFRLHLESLESMFRTQEHVYRAIALFQQSGEHIPASSGVCTTITLASSHRAKSKKLLPSTHINTPIFQTLPMDLQEWKEIIEELQTEFGCLKKSRKATTGDQGR